MGIVDSMTSIISYYSDSIVNTFDIIYNLLYIKLKYIGIIPILLIINFIYDYKVSVLVSNSKKENKNIIDYLPLINQKNLSIVKSYIIDIEYNKRSSTTKVIYLCSDILYVVTFILITIGKKIDPLLVNLTLILYITSNYFFIKNLYKNRKSNVMVFIMSIIYTIPFMRIFIARSIYKKLEKQY